MIDEIIEENPKKVFLQAPDGLKSKLMEISDELKEKNIDSVISIDSCFGACDLKLNECEKLDCDLYVHLGHNEFFRKIESNVKILYFPWKLQLNFNNWDELDKIDEEKIGLVSTIQYVDELDKVKEKAEERNKTAVIGGQVLGCWTENADKLDVDALLYVGSGEFHPLALNDKKVYKLDIEKGEIVDLTDEINKLEKIRQWNIAKAKNAEIFGILVSSKPGQFNDVENIKKKLETNNKKYYVFIGNEINKDNLEQFKVDVLVNTACPRLSEDKFDVPVVNFEDLDKVF